MLRLIRRPFVRHTHNATRGGTRLRLESLETRDCPAAPIVTSLSVQQGSGHNVVITGTVQDNTPSLDQVNLSGVVSGSITPAANGSFSATLPASAVGSVTAVAVNTTQRLSSPSVSAAFVNNAPQISVNMQYTHQRGVRFTGMVTDENAAGSTVYFSGQVTGSAIVAADGTFSFEAQASGLGNVLIHATDQWGLESTSVTKTLTTNQPGIAAFMVWQTSYGDLVASGCVTDEDPVGLVVTIKAGDTVLAQPVTTQSGNFQAPVTIPPNYWGPISAQTVDWWGVLSEVAYTYMTA